MGSRGNQELEDVLAGGGGVSEAHVDVFAVGGGGECQQVGLGAFGGGLDDRVGVGESVGAENRVGVVLEALEGEGVVGADKQGGGRGDGDRGAEGRLDACRGSDGSSGLTGLGWFAGGGRAGGDIEDGDTCLREGLEGAEDVTVCVGADTLGEMAHAAEAANKGLVSRHEQLGLDPLENGRHVLAGQEAVLGQDGAGAGDGTVLACVHTGDSVAINAGNPLVAAARLGALLRNTHRPVCLVASARVDVDGLDRDGD